MNECAYASRRKQCGELRNVDYKEGAGNTLPVVIAAGAVVVAVVSVVATGVSVVSFGQLTHLKQDPPRLSRVQPGGHVNTRFLSSGLHKKNPVGHPH